jgi:hypothetical protein
MRASPSLVVALPALAIAMTASGPAADRAVGRRSQNLRMRCYSDGTEMTKEDREAARGHVADFCQLAETALGVSSDMAFVEHCYDVGHVSVLLAASAERWIGFGLEDCKNRMGPVALHCARGGALKVNDNFEWT